MKRILITLTVLALLACKAQAEEVAGTFAGLARQDVAFLLIDLSEAQIHGMSEEDFAAYEEDWYKDKPQIIGMFNDYLTRQTDKLLSLSPKEKPGLYTVCVHVHNINAKGRYTFSTDIVAPGGTVEATIKHITAPGGTFGTKLNLIKDGACHSGKTLGKILHREIKKARK